MSMDIHLFSTDESALELIEHLPSGDKVVAVIVPSNRLGQEKIEKLTAASEARDLTVFHHQVFKSLPDGLPPAEVGISWLYSQIIREDDLSTYPRGILNMHGGRIPEYRGCSILHWTIINGETESGITWHECVKDVDAGAIWAESTIPIPSDATAGDMRKANIRAGIELFPTAWSLFRDRIETPRYPNLEEGRIWPQRRPADGEILPNWTERQVRDMVRALCPPWPPPTIRTSTGIYAINKVVDKASSDTVSYQTQDGVVLNLLLLRDGET